MTIATAPSRPSSRNECSGFLPIGVDTITVSTELPFNLYLRVNPAAPPVLYRERHLAMESSDFDRLSEQDITTLYIQVADHVAYRDYLIETVLHNRDVPGPRRFHVLKIANRAVFRSAFGDRNPEKLVNFAAQYGDELADIVCDEDLAVGELLGLMEHDYYTYTHATNVSVLSVLIARELGMGVCDGIVPLGSGAVIHDIGKRQIAPALLNQQQPLSEEQRETIQQHPKFGFMELSGRRDLLWGQLMMVYQHHERWDGRGYPVGFVGEEIHPWARICAVADVYDAMISSRPYRRGLPANQVWEVLEGGSKQEFDREFVKALRSVVKE
ncbi:MAG: HD domain-containing protein [Planctomycetaceae bacterium]|nr:HD domain-containing protein [Planctomycetaceae bacterium]